MYQKFTTTLICSTITLFSLIAAPSLDLFAIPISLISIVILFFAVKGKSRFYITLILICLIFLSFVITYLASKQSLELANDVALHQRNLSQFGPQFADEFKINNTQNAKYFEIISNYSFINIIMLAIFSLFISKNDKQEIQHEK